MKHQDANAKKHNEERIKIILHKTKKNTNTLLALAATKHKRIIKEYATMGTIYTPPSLFSGGFAKAIECIEMMALEVVNNGFSKVGAQDYKWANVFIDKVTGDILDLKELLNHPKYTETWTRAASNEYGRLFQGYGRKEYGTQHVERTNVCHWIRKE